jgi:KDO2-lipid IV(A) lauroyltransferase
MARKRNRVVEAITFGAVWIFYHLTRISPLPLSRAVTIAIGRVALALVPRLHKVGMENLDLAYGDELSQAEKKRILQGAMDNMAIVAAEFSHTKTMAQRNFDGVISIEGVEHFDFSNSGVVAISSHKATWEWLAAGFVAEGIPTAEVVRPLDIPALNALVDRTRRFGGIETIPKDKASHEMARLLSGRYIVGLLVDQSARNNAVPTTFFGQPCWSTIGAAMVALRAGVPVHYVDNTRQPDGSYRMTVSPPIEVISTGNTARDLQRITQTFQDLAEEAIRRHPEQWLWFHRRWKQRDRLEQEWQERLAKADAKAGGA